MCFKRLCCGDATMFGCCPGKNDVIFKPTGYWIIRKTDIKCFYSVCGAYWCCRGLTTLCNIVAILSTTGMMIIYSPLLLLDKCCGNCMQVYNDFYVNECRNQVELFNDIFCLTDRSYPCLSQYVFFRCCCCCCVKIDSILPISSQPLEVVSSGSPAPATASLDEEIPPPYGAEHRYVTTNFTGFTNSINESNV